MECRKLLISFYAAIPWKQFANRKSLAFAGKLSCIQKPRYYGQIDIQGGKKCLIPDFLFYYMQSRKI